MRHIAQRLHALQESSIREMTRLALRYDAINLSQGLPDFSAPEEVKEAAARAILEDNNQYSITWGLPETRQAVAEKMPSLYGLSVDPERDVTITCGVSEAIVDAVLATVDPGDEVIIMEPFHENYVPAVRFAGGVPQFVTLSPPDFRLNPDELRKVFGPRTRALIINTPHNPTGHVFTREELTLIGELATEWDTIIISDEIYEHILYDGRTHVPPMTLPGLAERVITLGGLSKTYAVTGWRLGYAVVLNEAIGRALRTVHDYATICAPTPLQKAAVAALHLPAEYYKQQIRAYTHRRALIMEALQRAGFQARPPEGAYYVLADFGALGWKGDDVAFAHWLTKEVGVAVVPGSAFYEHTALGRTQVRFAFAKQPATLKEAGRRLLRVRERMREASHGSG